LGGAELQIAALVTLNVHLQNGRAGHALWPTAQVGEELFGGHVQRVSPNVAVPMASVGGRVQVDKGHPQSLRSQHQGQAAPDDASASDANVKLCD
jgi:hypothetical protein